MSEWVDEPALAMDPPRHLVVPDLVAAAVRARRHCSGHEGVWIVEEDLDPNRPRPERGRRLPAVVLGLAQEERGAVYLEAHDRAQAPELRRPEGPLVPSSR